MIFRPSWIVFIWKIIFNLIFLYSWLALFTRDILAHNIAIKRYCHKKIISRHMFQWATKISSEKNIPWFFKELTLAYRDPWLKNIFLSQYLFITILGAKMSSVNKALKKYHCEMYCNFKRFPSLEVVLPSSTWVWKEINFDWIKKFILKQ